MAQATKTTAGEIVLSGDLAGGDDGYYPELRASGVTPGTYSPIERVSVDSKGRVTAVGKMTPETIASAFSITTANSKGVMQVGASLTSMNGVLSISDASKSSLGILQAGNGLWEENGVLSITSEATNVTKGRVQIGSGVLVNDGRISMPIAEKTSPGVVTAGFGFGMDKTIPSRLAVTAGDATAAKKGLMKVGAGLVVSGGVVSIPPASSTIKGLFQVGSGLTQSGGQVSLGALTPATSTTRGAIQTNDPSLNVVNNFLNVTRVDATTSAKGVVQIGSGLAITDGVVSLNGPDATAATKGFMQPGTGINIDADSVISRPLFTATTSTNGHITVSSGLAVTAAGVLSLNAPNATTATKGVIQAGNGIQVSPEGLMSVSSPVPSAAGSKGIVQIGNRLQVLSGVVFTDPIDADYTVAGRMQVGYGLAVSNGVVSFNLPAASKSQKGIIQINDPLITMTDSVMSSSIPVANATTRGRVAAGPGTTLVDGTLSLNTPDATTTSKGVVQIGTNIYEFGSDGVGGVVYGIQTVGAANSNQTEGWYGKGVVNVPANSGLAVTNGVVSANTASSSTKGQVQIGTSSGFVIADGQLSLAAPDATKAAVGQVQIGAGFGVTNGVIETVWAGSGGKGVVSVDGTSGLTIAGGQLSVGAASKTTKGFAQIGYGINLSAGVISLPNASTTTKGVLKNSADHLGISSDISFDPASGGLRFNQYPLYRPNPLDPDFSVTNGAITLTAAPNLHSMANTIVSGPGPNYAHQARPPGGFRQSYQKFDASEWQDGIWPSPFDLTYSSVLRVTGYNKDVILNIFRKGRLTDDDGPEMTTIGPNGPITIGGNPPTYENFYEVGQVCTVFLGRDSVITGQRNITLRASPSFPTETPMTIKKAAGTPMTFAQYAFTKLTFLVVEDDTILVF